MLRLEDRELIRWCGEQGTGVLSYGPLAYGLLTGAITSETRFDRGDWRGGDEEDGSVRREKPAANLALVDGLRPIAERLGITHRAARARVERRAAGGDRGDRRQPEPRPRRVERRGRRRRARTTTLAEIEGC